MANTTKIGKTHRFISEDIYNFSNDPIRKFISSVDPTTLKISLNESLAVSGISDFWWSPSGSYLGIITLQADNQDICVDFIKEIEKYRIYNTILAGRIATIPAGSITLPDGRIAAPTNNYTIFGPQSKKINDFCFYLDTHYEEVGEILNYEPPQNSTTPQQDLRALNNILKFRANLEYNFRIEKYENFLNNYQNVSELNLPYFYEILEFRLLGNLPELSDTRNFDGVKGTFKGVADLANTSFLNSDEKDLKNIINVSSTRTELKTLVLNSKIGVSETEILSIDKYLQNYYGFREQFPFYTDVSIITHAKPQDNISDVMHDSNLYSEFLENIPSTTATGSYYFKRTPSIELLENKKIKTLDVDQTFINNLISNNAALASRINTFINNKKRDFTSVLLGNDAYVEVVAYHLQKFEEKTNSLLQEWILPNVGENIKWIDTQIKYGKGYTYKINTLALVVGNEYQYKNWQLPTEKAVIVDTLTNKIEIYFSYVPKIKILNIDTDIKYFNTLIDNPPVEPDVTILPFVSVDNKLQIFFNTGIGRLDKEPVIKNDAEKVMIDKLKIVQDRKMSDTKIIFESDEASRAFELYRSETRPKTYNDMFKELLTVIETNGATAAAYSDSIVPNRKYYYMARSVDYHDKNSNPTHIFEVELINDNGTIYPNIEIVQFDKNEMLKTNLKSFRRYLKIAPALKQILVKDENKEKDNIKLGLSTDSVWDKNMKIRLTSKQTGRKIDLNFKFKYDIK